MAIQVAIARRLIAIARPGNRAPMNRISGIIRANVRGAAALWRRAARERLHLPRMREGSFGPTVYFLVPDFDRPAGGILTIYRHVDALNFDGIRAFVLHQRKGFRCTWFENRTPVAYARDTTLSSRDLLVVSELDIDLLSRTPPGMSLAIFNQSGHLTWVRGAQHVAAHYSSNPGLRGVVVVSDHSRAMLSYTFPKLPLYRVHLGLDSSLWYPEPERRLRRICYMPRRGREDAELILQILAERGSLRDWMVTPLDGLRLDKVAETLRTSRIFLALSYQEGFGLPVAEAMACGNYVIGYHAHGGRELFQPHFSEAVEAGDVLGVARALERAVKCDNKNDGWCLNLGLSASKFVLENYSLTRERRDVLNVYANLLGK